MRKRPCILTDEGVIATDAGSCRDGVAQMDGSNIHKFKWLLDGSRTPRSATVQLVLLRFLNMFLSSLCYLAHGRRVVVY